MRRALILTPQVVKWMSLADNEATPAACNWVYPIIGILEQSPAQVGRCNPGVEKEFDHGDPHARKVVQCASHKHRIRP